MATPAATPTPARKRRSRYPFVLKGIDVEEVSHRYSFTCNKDICKFIPKDNVTKLDELIGSPEREFSYLDETKHKRKVVVAMYDCSSSAAVGGKRTRNIHCFWCRHPFDTLPLGCPVRYVPSYIARQYFSHITKDYYTIKEEVSNDRFNEVVAATRCRGDETNDPSTIRCVNNDYYEVDGVFCSFNCCMAWIADNPRNSLYVNSGHLLHEMYTKCFDASCRIQPAPHWRMLEEYGGHMTIQEFRASFNKRAYDNMHVLRTMPKTKPVGTVFEEFLKI